MKTSPICQHLCRQLGRWFRRLFLAKQAERHSSGRGGDADPRRKFSGTPPARQLRSLK